MKLTKYHTKNTSLIIFNIAVFIIATLLASFFYYFDPNPNNTVDDLMKTISIVHVLLALFMFTL